MQQYRKNLGKVSLTSEGAWSREKFYEILSIVYDEHTQRGFISRQNVPQGIDLYNKEYWMPFNVSGYADNNMIILADKVNEHSIKSYTLEEAILSIAQVGRRPGTILGFYNENVDRLDIGGRWELWQFNDTNIYNWENVTSWQSLYYNYNKFVGWFENEDFLVASVMYPEIGCYAFVGSELNEATIYRCDSKHVWHDTTQHAWDYVKINVGGNVTIGENGNWFNNGVDTKIPATIKGENGKTPLIRNNNNILEYSYDNKTWTPISDKIAAWFRLKDNKIQISQEQGVWSDVSDYIAAWFRWQATTADTQANNIGRLQISRDGKTWETLSPDISNNLHISRYIAADASLPTTGIAEGTIYAKGPTYAEDDTNHDYPKYRLWVYAWKDNTLAWQDNGEFNSIAAGVTQTTGDSETEVMSQKAVTEKLSELGSKVFGNISEYSVVSGVKYDWTFAVDIDIKEGEEFTILLETDAISTIAPHYIGCTEQGETNKVVYDKFFVYTNKEKTFVATKNTSRLYIPYTATAVKDGFIKLKVSKGDTLADKIDKCNEDINELTEEIENVRNNIGYIGKSATAEYSVVAETKYDWTFAVDIDINIGEEFKVLFESDVYNGPLYIGYTEQGNTNITAYDNLYVIPNEEKTFVATKNTSRLYIPYSLTPKKDGTIKLYVSVGETLDDKINEIENNVNDLSGDIKEIEGNISSLLTTVYTKEYQVEVGGNYDWKLAVDVDIDEGEEFSILVNTSATPNPLYFGYTEKGTTKKVAYKDGFVIPNVEKKFISTNNIQTLYIPYSFTPKQNGIFSITVKKGGGIFEKIEEKVKEEVKKSNPHPMDGKTFYSIGDSHRWKWLNKLSELTGGISGGDIFSDALTAYEKYYVSRTVAMAKYIVDLYKSGKPVDYIFMEYVHKYFVNNMKPANWYHYSGDITEAEPFLTQAYYDYTQNTFNNTSEAESFWNDNFATIVGGFTPKSNAIIALKTGVKVQSPKFKLSGSATTGGNFTIKFTDSSGELHQMSIAIPSGLSINEALTIVNEIEFSDSGSKWDNLSAHNTITDATIKFTYNGNLNDVDASIKMGFDFGTTGIVYDGDWTINTETKDWTRGFKSHDVSKWSDKTKWNNLYANVDAYIWIKAAVELLQREIPQAKIFVWTLNTEEWDYNTNTIEGQSVLYPDGMLNVQAIYNSERHKRMVQNLEGWRKVAKYYHLGFIPISEMNNISPANHKYYYPSDDVHPTQEGYDRVAEILAKNIY